MSGSSLEKHHEKRRGNLGVEGVWWELRQVIDVWLREQE